MRIKHMMEIPQIQDLEYIDSDVCSSALTTGLIARLARRPGRWQRRIPSRQIAFNEWAPVGHDEAA
jgi:hypothetical protein